MTVPNIGKSKEEFNEICLRSKNVDIEFQGQKNQGN